MRMDLTNCEANKNNEGKDQASSFVADLKDLPVGDLIGKFDVEIEIEEMSE